eukprot:149602_1
MSTFFHPSTYILNNLFIFTLVNSATIWYESMQANTGFSNWIESQTPQPTSFDFQSGTQTNGCPTTDWDTIKNDCWRFCNAYAYIYRSASTTGYKNISLEFDIDPWSMQSNNQYCDIEWSTDNTNWNLIHRSSGSEHIVNSIFYLYNTSWNQPNINIRIYINSNSPSSCCYISHFSLNGSPITPETTARISTTMYTTTTVTTGTNFFIDNDWVLKESYPFPVNKCIQTSPDLVERHNTYYECSPNGQQITKYKWIQQITDCSDRNTADETTIYSKNAAGTSCDLYHFECDGTNDYVTADFYLAINTDCATPSPLFTISVASNICYCETATSSLKLTCDSSDAYMHNYTGNSCSSQQAPQQSLGRPGAPKFFITYTPFYICAETVECIVDSFNSVTTKSPTTSTTLKVTHPPTRSGGEGGVNDIETTYDRIHKENENSKVGIFDIIIQYWKFIAAGVLGILICCLFTCICCYRRKRKKQVSDVEFVKPQLNDHFGVNSTSHVLPNTPPPVVNNDIQIPIQKTQIIQNHTGEDVEMMLVEGNGMITTNTVDMIAMSPVMNSNFSYERNKHVKGQDTVGFENNLKNVVAGIDMVMDDMINEMEQDGHGDGNGQVTGGGLGDDYLGAAQRQEFHDTGVNQAEVGYELDANSDA